jgi:H+/Na+-translocating ferredoxin:NAD+ oxidoreductase subunit D
VSPKNAATIPNVPERWLIATSPHVRSAETVSQMMWTVFLALLPACVAGLIIFGWRAGVVMALAVFSAMITEGIIQKYLKRPVTISDGSAAVTGLLLAMCLPPSVSWYVPVIGSFVAIFVGKQIFGGLGRNYFNPALIGRAFLQFAFASQVSLSKWPILYRGANILEAVGNDVCKVDGGGAGQVEAISHATPLAALKSSITDGTFLSAAPDSALPLDQLASTHCPHPTGSHAWEMTQSLGIGYIPGCIGEVCKVALILGGLILLANRLINWRLPLAYILSAVVVALLLPLKTLNPAGESVMIGLWAGQWSTVWQLAVVHLLSGGLLLGAIFMITDMVTSPTTNRGQIIYGISAGILVALIRVYGASYPEGVCYSILLVNSARLLIEKVSRPRVFGTGKGARHA